MSTRTFRSLQCQCEIEHKNEQHTLKKLNLPVRSYFSLLWFWCIQWLPSNSLRISNFQECYWKVLDFLLADITGLVSFDTKPLYCTVLVSKCKLTFTTAFHPKSIPSFRDSVEEGKDRSYNLISSTLQLKQKYEWDSQESGHVYICQISSYFCPLFNEEYFL